MHLTTSEEIPRIRHWQDAVTRLDRIYRGHVPADGLRGSIQPQHLVGWRILSGRATVDSAEGAISANPGDWLFLPDSPRTHIIEPGTEMISIHYRFHWRNGHAIYRFEPGLQAAADSVPGLDGAAEELRKTVWQQFRRYPVHLEAERLGLAEYWSVRRAFDAWTMAAVPLWQAGKAAFNPPAVLDARAERLRQWLDAHRLDAFPDWEEAGRVVGLSRSQIARVFAATYRISPARYFDSQRFQNARMALTDPSMPIKQVASQLGFRHLSKFSNWFTRHEGMAPRKYQAQSGLIQ